MGRLVVQDESQGYVEASCMGVLGVEAGSMDKINPVQMGRLGGPDTSQEYKNARWIG